MGNFVVYFRAEKNMAGDSDCAVLELVPLRGKTHFKTCPQNTILVYNTGILCNHW